MCNVRSVNLDVEREMSERVVVLTVTYGVETWGMRKRERHTRDVMEIKCYVVCATDQNVCSEE